MGKWLSEHKSISIGGGIAMLTSLGQIFSDKVKDHPHLAAAFFMVGVLMVIVPLLAPLFGKRESIPLSENANSTGRDNFGHQIHAPGGTVIIGDGNTTSAVVIAPSLETDSRPSVTPTTVEVPFLKTRLEFVKIVYSLPSSAWVEATSFDYRDSRVALIVWFSNPLAAKGERGISVRGVAAHLNFSILGIPSEQISAAYWLNKSEGRIDIRSGDQAGIVVAVEEWGRWVCYCNPYERPADEEFLQPALRHPGDKKTLISGQNLEMHVDISLITADSTTVEAIGISIGFKNGSPYGILNT